LKDGEEGKFVKMLTEKTQKEEKVSVEIREIVFDYFNIITKEYEISYEKWKDDKDYSKELEEIKKNVDSQIEG